MRIRLRTRKMKLTAAQRSKVELQLGLALSRFGDRVGRVVGHLWDEGKRGAPDRRCRIDVDVHPTRISVEEGDADLTVAVRRAATRVSRSITRTLERARRLDA